MTTILVVDDSPSEMMRFKEILSKHGYKVIEASNGMDGYEMAVKHLPQVVLMDIVMPEMNGFQATRKITKDKTTAHIPVVIVSTKNQETDRLWGKRQGAKEYLTKPVDEHELIRVVRSVLE